MGSRRTLILVAAIAIGAVAAFLVWGYVGGIQNKAYGNAEKVKVFVVKSAIKKGTYGEEAKGQKLIVEDEIPKKFFPPNAIRSLDTDLGGKVAVNDLAVNQIVTNDMFADPISVQTTFADRLEKIRGKDQTAITISVDTIHGVAGLLQPGDYVNVMSVPPCGGATSNSTDTGTSSGGATGAPTVDAGACDVDGGIYSNNARYVLQKVQILAIDQTPVAQPGEVTAAASDGTDKPTASTGSRGLITFIVPADTAQEIASIGSANFYLTLVPRDYEPTPQGPIDSTKPLPADDANSLTPYGPDGPGK